MGSTEAAKARRDGVVAQPTFAVADNERCLLNIIRAGTEKIKIKIKIKNPVRLCIKQHNDFEYHSAIR
jgi:hypothetical protein